MNQEITDYITSAPAHQREAMELIRKLLHEVPGISEQFKWSRPVFAVASDFAYFKTSKSHLTVGFYNPEKITAHTLLLEGTGKSMRHIKIKNIADWDMEILKQFIRETSR